MALTLNTKPDTFALVYSPQWVKLITTDYCEERTAGSVCTLSYKPSVDGVPAASDAWTIILADYSLPLTTTLTFEYQASGLDTASNPSILPTKGGAETDAEYSERWAQYVAGNAAICALFDTWYLMDEDRATVYFRAKPGRTDVLLYSYARTVGTFTHTFAQVTARAEGIYKEKYKARLQLWIESPADSGVFLPEVAETVAPSWEGSGLNHSAVFRIDQLLAAHFEGRDIYPLLSLSTPARKIQDLSTVRKYRMKYWQDWEGNTAAPVYVTSEAFACFGAENMKDHLDNTRRLSSATAAVESLTLDPDLAAGGRKVITDLQPVHIALFNIDSSDVDVRVDMVFTHRDGTTEAVDDAVAAYTHAVGEKWVLNLGFHAWASWLTTPEDVVRYTASVINDTTEEVLHTYSFTVLCHRPVHKCLLVLNHLGGWESILFEGGAEYQAEREEERGQRIVQLFDGYEPGQTFAYNVETSQKRTLTTLAIDTQQKLAFYRQILQSRYMAEAVVAESATSFGSGYYMPVLPDGRAVKLGQDRAGSQVLEFEILEAWPHKGL